MLVLTCSIAAHSFGALTSQSLQYDDLNRLIGVDYGKATGWGRAKITAWFDRVKAEYLDGIWP